MTTHTRWTTALWVALGLLVSTAPAVMAQGGGSLPAYGEPTIISSPGLGQVFVADFTSDGMPDFATLNSGGTVTVHPGLGNGSFGTGITSAGWSGGGPSGPKLGDFNGDGAPDLVFTQVEDFGSGQNPVGVILGTGAGTFEPYKAAGSLPSMSVTSVGDFDGDGRSDIAGSGCWIALFETEQHCAVVFLWGRADGNVDRTEFKPAATIPTGLLFAGEFNGDGVRDVAWSMGSQNVFSVALGQGGRTFASPVAHASAGAPSQFASADFNADGKEDLAVLYSGGIGILRGNGDGSFQAVTFVGAVSGGPDIAAWDINGDGRPDLSINAAEGVALLVNGGDGSFRRYALTAGFVEPHTYFAPAGYATADFNDDGRPDFVVAFLDQKVGLYLGQAAFSTSLATSSAASTHGQLVTLTATVTPSDLTGPVTFYDGAQVLGGARISGGQAVFSTRTLAPGSHTLRAAYGGTLMGAQASPSNAITHTVTALPALGFRPSFDVSPDFLAHGLAPGDFDGDGTTDFLATDYAHNRFGLFRGNGDGTFQIPSLGWSEYPRYIPRRIVLGDVNLDGKQDFAFHTESTSSVLVGNGDGTFSAGTGSQGFTWFADVNGDGKPDRIITGWGQISTWLGVGDSKGSTLSFAAFDLIVGSGLSEIALGDFNGDAKVDVAMTTAQENRVYVLMGVGDGTFSAPRVNTVGNGPASPVVGDFNADGKLDLAFVSAGSGKVSVLPGKGDGDFLAAVDTTLGGTLTRMAAADLTGDAKMDLAVLSTSEDRLLVLPGNGNGTFGAARKYYVGTVPMELAAADFDGNGRMDLAVSSNADVMRGGPTRVTVLLGVNPGPTAVQLQAQPTSASLSQPVTLTATVTPPTATGWVTFNDGATPLGSAPVAAGQAVFQTRLLGSGGHLLAAVFSGDGTLYDPSASAPVAVHIAASPVTDFAPSTGVSPGAASLAAQADFNGDGVVDLIACNASQTTVLLGQGAGQFTAATPVSVGCSVNILTADFNRDGKPDLAMGTTIAFGQGDGTFGVPQAIAGSEGLVVAADFNGDGATDLADVTGRIFLNRGAGTFESPYRLSLGLTVSFYYAVAADVNADGRADLIVPAYGTGYVHVLLASTDGYLLPAVPYPTVAGPMSVVVADFNGDSIQDLAVGDYGGSGGRVGIMLGLGPGTFENWGDTSIGWAYSVRWLSSCDCDGDGNVDLLASAYTGQPTLPNVKLLRGLGDGTFQAAVDYATIPDAQWWLLMDLNQDGRPDIVHNSWQAGTPIYAQMAVAQSSVSVAAAPQPAVLSGAVTLTATVSPLDAAGTVAFYDGATILGKAEISAGHAVLTTKWLAAGTHALFVVYGGDPLHYTDSVSPAISLTVAAKRNRGFADKTSFATGRGPKGIAAGDLNGDGKQDLVVANATSNTISVFLGNGAGGFAPRVNYNTGTTPVAVIVADVNEDGNADVAAACSGSNAVNVLLGNGNGTLQAAVNRAAGAPAMALAAADVNMDQATDLAVATNGGGLLAAFMDAGGAWPAAGWTTVMASTDNLSGLGAADLDGDGRTDALAPALSGWVYRSVQQPGGSFVAGWTGSGGNTPTGLAIADFNDDGVADLAVPNRDSNNVGALVGMGDGSFAAAALYPTGTGPTAIATTDVDGDGRLDLVVANGGSNNLTMLLGQGNGTFLAGGTLATGSTPAGVVAGDFNADGVVDLAVTNGASDTVSVFLGQAAPPTEGPRGDFTGDLKSDVLWRHASRGDLWLWPMNGPARTAESYVRTVSDTNWEIRAIGDFDGDGMADLFWRNAVNGQMYFWPMDGSTAVDEIYAGTVDPAYDIVGSGDFDGDGKADLLWRHTTLGDVWVWLMDGATALEEVFVDRVDPGYVVKGVGDLDADGKADIVWHGAAGDVWVWPMHGTTRLDQVWVGTVPDTGYQIEGVADVTGDGKADLVWWHATRGEVWLWTMNGPAREAEDWVGTVPDTNYQIAGTGDYNGDGKADLLWQNAVNGEVWVWLMNGPVRVSETWVATVPDTGYRVVTPR